MVLYALFWPPPRGMGFQPMRTSCPNKQLSSQALKAIAAGAPGELENAMRITEFIGTPDAFPILRHWDFFNHAGVAPIPRIGADALRTFAQQAEDGAYLETRWYKDIESLRASTAKLINASPDEIAFIKNT